MLSDQTIQRVKSNNCFDFIRYFFALSLIIVHFCTVTEHEQFWFVTGGTRVKAFFIITGFLVVYSYLRSNNLKLYIKKRFNRIFPAYFMVILFCFIVGMLFTQLSFVDYITDSQTYKYLISNILFLNFIEPCLPGVFTDNYMPFMNGSLWSMKVEVLFYIIVPLLIWYLYSFKKEIVIVIVFMFSIIYNEIFSYLFTHTGNKLYFLLQHQLGGQMIYFFGGTVLLLYFDKFCSNIRWIFPIGLILYIASSRFHVPYLLYIEPLSFAIVIIGIAYFCKPLNFLQKYDNISYGLYLYHFPVIQILVHFHLDKYNIYMTFILTLLITITLSLLSWFMIEKRFIIRK